MQPSECPYCGRPTKELPGYFEGRSQAFVFDPKRVWVLKTQCTACKRFLGYRRPEKDKKHA